MEEYHTLLGLSMINLSSSIIMIIINVGIYAEPNGAATFIAICVSYSYYTSFVMQFALPTDRAFDRIGITMMAKSNCVFQTAQMTSDHTLTHIRTRHDDEYNSICLIIFIFYFYICIYLYMM